MDIISIILLIILVVSCITLVILEYIEKNIIDEILEEHDELIETQLDLEQVILDAKTKKELPFITVEKIEKVLFPNANKGK